jgi:RNA polymerase sigma-70 factor, ECF subfamily
MPPPEAVLYDEETLTSLSDEELVALFVARGARDDRPFREIFRRHQQMVWRVCYSIVQNPQDAEDLTQEVFVRVHHNLHRFEGRSSLKTWLYRIAFNTSHNELRRRARSPELEEHSVEDLAEFLPEEYNLEEYWLLELRNERLRQAVLSLTAEQQELIRLRDVEQRPYTEIAEMQEISLSAAKMRVQRARLALQGAYNALEMNHGF